MLLCDVTLGGQRTVLGKGVAVHPCSARQGHVLGLGVEAGWCCGAGAGAGGVGLDSWDEREGATECRVPSAEALS